MSLVAACVLYGLLLFAFAVCSPAALALYWSCRRHPVISKRAPWLTVLSVAFTSLLSVTLVLQLLLPFLPAAAADSFPCSALYAASFLYPALALLPYGLRAVRVLQLYSAAAGAKSPLLSALSRPAFQLSALLLATALCAGAAVCWSAWGGADSRADSLSLTPPSLCLLFDNWRFFAPLCGLAFLPFSLCAVRLAEQQRERDVFSLCRELCCSWLTMAVLGVAYFVLMVLPWAEGEVEAPFPLSSLLIALHGLLLLQSVLLPLLAVRSFNRTHRTTSTAALQPEQGAAATAATNVGSRSRRGTWQRAASVAAAAPTDSAPEGQKRAGSGPPGGADADDCDPLQQTTSLDGVTVGGGADCDASAAAAERRAASGSLDVSNVWSLERILLDPAANALLERHADRFLCSELLRCWNTITAHHRQHWRMDDPQSLDAAYASSAAIYSQFIRAGSAQEVNVDSKIRSQLAALFDRPLHAAERRAVMARDLHARKKLSREMERKQQQQQQQRQGSAVAGKRGSKWRLQAGVLRQAGNRPRTTTPSSAISASPSAGRATQSSLASVHASQQQRNTVCAIEEETALASGDAAAAAPSDSSSGGGAGGPAQPAQDETAAGRDAPLLLAALSDGLPALQAEHEGVLGSVQPVAVASSASSPARSVRSATVQYGASSGSGLLSLSELSGAEALMPETQLLTASLQSSQSQRFLAIASSSCLSQTLQMPLQQYDGHSAPASPSAEQQQPATAPASSYSSPARGPLPPLHITVGPEDFVSRESPPAAGQQQQQQQQQEPSPQARVSDSGSGSSSAGRRPSVLHFATAGRPLPTGDLSAAVSGAEADDVTDDAANAGKRCERAGSQTVPVTPSRSSSSSSSASSCSQFSSSTPFPLSALEVAALSSHLIWQRCQHEVRKLIDTNLYLSFIRESADFRRYRLAKRKEERQRQAEARARQKAEEAEAAAALRLASIQLQVSLEEEGEEVTAPQLEGQQQLSQAQQPPALPIEP